MMQGLGSSDKTVLQDTEISKSSNSIALNIFSVDLILAVRT